MDVLNFISILIGGGVLGIILQKYIESKREKQARLREIYNLLYDDMYQITNEELQTKLEYDEMDPHRKYEIDEEIRDLFESYIEKQETLRNLIRNIKIEMYNRGQEQSHELYIKNKETRKIKLRNNRKQGLYLDNFVDTFGLVLLQCANAEELGMELKLFAEKENRSSKDTFRWWPDEYYNEIWDVIESAESSWVDKTDYSNKNEMLGDIEKDGEIICSELESQIEKVRTWRYWFP